MQHFQRTVDVSQIFRFSAYEINVISYGLILAKLAGNIFKRDTR